MANTRFLYTNKMEATAVVLKNGTGGAPALDEVTGYAMTNALLADRRSLWKSSSGAAMPYDVDLTGAASNTSIGVAAILGHRPTTSSGIGIIDAIVKGSTHANGYPPVAASAWTNLGTISLTGAARNSGVVFNATSIRYLRFEITCFDNFTVGRLWAGVVDSDTGGIYAPGANVQQIVPKVEQPTIGGSAVVSFLGDPYERFSLPWMKADATLRGKLRTCARKQQTIVYVDHDDLFREVYVGNYSDSHVWNTPALYDGCQLDLIELG